jgi:ectoine hydroxylase-related dioxygenase (phytanoyl-CoA dioxygenase family)
MDLEPVLAAYRTDGYARLGRIVSAAGLELLRERADDVMQGRVDPQRFFYQHDTTSGRYEDLEIGRGWVGPSESYRKIEKLERDERFAAFLANTLFARIARAWIGDSVVLYRAILMTKSRTGGTVLPWHQDAGSFWGLDRDPDLQIWTALDDAPEDGGCVEVVPKSHATGLATPLGGMIPDAIAHTRDAEAVPLPAQAGESLLLHNLLWHRSSTSHTGHLRRAFSICLMNAATRCLRRRRAPRVFPRVFE